MANTTTKFEDTSTETLRVMYREVKADAIALAFVNLEESSRLGELAWKIGRELDRRGFSPTSA
jgi:hypothetical protein